MNSYFWKYKWRTCHKHCPGKHELYSHYCETSFYSPSLQAKRLAKMCIFILYMYFKQTLQYIKDTNNKHFLYSFTVNGGWTGWSRWGTWGGCHGSSCVGQQKRLRTRSCTHPRQRNGGRHCRGSSFEWMSRSCRPVHSKGKINTRCKSENGTYVQTIYILSELT